MKNLNLIAFVLCSIGMCMFLGQGNYGLGMLEFGLALANLHSWAVQV